MRVWWFFLALMYLGVTSAYAKEMRDTLWTTQNDKIILSYNLMSDNNIMTVEFSRPRVIPSSSLNRVCKGDIGRIKVVMFDRVGDFGNTRWGGLTPSAFMIPGGMSYERSSDGFYILGESGPVEFAICGQPASSLMIPIYVAVYDKKLNYRIVAASKKALSVSVAKIPNKTVRRPSDKQRGETERIAVTSAEEIESGNTDITDALSSIALVRELLERETTVPFSQTLQMEIYNLRNLKNQMVDPEIVGKINEMLLLCDEKERQLKEAIDLASASAAAEQQSQIDRQNREAEEKKKEAEEKERMREEKQQKLTMWMIIGGVLLAVAAFIGNAVLKHFRDLRNQKNMMRMQESLARQAQHEASRRSREIVRNKVHKGANDGRTWIREKVTDNHKNKNNSKIRSI